MHILLIDNYDSFTYNLVHQLRELKQSVTVIRNDELKPEALPSFDVLMLSPGPGIPCEAGYLLETIEYFASRKPILGICLGHQALAEVFGGSLFNLPKVYHGLADSIQLDADPLFADLEQSIEVGRYHSWVVEPSSLPDTLRVIARDSNRQIMALRHRELPLYGVQFHPESILTPEGNAIIQNFLDLARPHVEAGSSTLVTNR